MAPAFASSSPPFAVLYLRPEIASGFYDFPPSRTTTDATTDDTSSSPPSDADVPSPDNGDTSAAVPPSTPPRFPGVPPDEAAFFLPDGQVVAAIRTRLRASGLGIVAERTLLLTKPQLRRLYFTGLNDDTAARAGFLDRFTRGPTRALLITLDPDANANENVSPDAAVVALRALVGPEHEMPSVTRQRALAAALPVDQWPLRALCGLNADFPGVYASATLDCAVRERHQLFPNDTADRSLESAVLALLPPLVDRIPDAMTQLLAAFGRRGVVVTSVVPRASLTADEIASIAAAELHPQTDTAQHAAFTARLERLTASDRGPTVVVRVVGFQLDATLREIVGPASIADAAAFFPESLRAQLPLVSTTEIDADAAWRSRENGETCLTTSLFVSRRPPVIQALALEDETVTQTLAIIKPNAASVPSVVDEIQRELRAFAFHVDQQKRLTLSRAQAEAFYAEHANKPFFRRLVDFMTSGDVVVLQLSRKLAVPLWRALMGPTNCFVARETHPWTLRARFGLDGTQNATHGSDAAASACRELRFFFGATNSNAHREGRVANATNTANGRDEPLENVLVRGLDALLQTQQAHQQLGAPLDACRWLGEWLLQQSEQPHDADDIGTNNTNTNNANNANNANAKTAIGRRAVPAVEKAVPSARQLPGDTHRIVAIVVDASVPAAAKDHVKQLVRDRAERTGSAFVDVALATGTIADHVANVGRRRVVLFDWDPQTPQAQQSAVGVSLVATLTTTSPSPLAVPNDPLVPHVTFPIPPTLQNASPLQNFFRTVLDPLVVVVVGDDKGNHGSQQGHPAWRATAARLGAVWLTFDALVSREIEREQDPLGAFTQWHRTRAALLPSLVLDALQRAIADPAALGFAPAAHKFVLVGFPWTTLDARALDHSVGRIACVVCAGAVESHGTSPWGAVLEKRGALVHCTDAAAVDAVLTRVLVPHVTLVLTADAGSTTSSVGAIRRTATEQGDVWISADALPSATTVATLRHLLLRASVAYQRVVVHGFPRTPAEAEGFVRDVAAPRAVLIVGKVSPDLDAVLDSIQRTAPHAVQSVVANTTSSSLLRMLLSPSRVAVTVGDSPALDAATLRKTLVAVGGALVDLRDQPLDADVALDTIAGVAAPRCLVLLNGAAHVDYIRALQSRLGDAFTQLVVLKQRRVQPPSPPRRADDDDYDSEEEREREKTRQREAAALSPALTRLVEALKTSNRPRVRVVSFLQPSHAHAELLATLQPKLVGVRGHALTFYREAVRFVCRTFHLPFVDLTHGATYDTDADADAVTASSLRRVLASCAASVVVVDGFPHASTVAPYAAQQLVSFETSHVATMPLFVRFRASIDVLLEKDPALSRHALEDAQDALDDAAAGDVDAAFTKRSTRVLRDVSCEGELLDAQDAFAHVLTGARLVDV